ncbi:hypothetical protein TVNIR_0190 [Thioalkalivibrio nitratireducens DSM 14787]|uniref:Uncharacterized protein n=1 Tax=Thioalkalivibrio nitratireducens (strain DSM 14787 / UNIQEM 213 / ALEN2) TaxID=1255043 RepID=L0DU93_THIND|nr:hypothetical protein TVNIR_0190 [Thioalkalivibrio nitratireducens DSM 14787]
MRGPRYTGAALFAPATATQRVGSMVRAGSRLPAPAGLGGA